MSGIRYKIGLFYRLNKARLEDFGFEVSVAVSKILFNLRQLWAKNTEKTNEKFFKSFSFNELSAII